MIDGSNLATEGRSMPSLKQLVEAVQAFMQDHPDTLVTVVVDATFGHRIDPREVPEFDAAVDHNELVTPPAGAVGRGDAFVLAIANKVGATIVSNDSYQEFHGEHTWLFDEGRLIGGKPVPHVGWVFVDRVPVRGPLSRRSTRDAKQKDRTRPPAKETAKDAARVAGSSPAASAPMPVPAAPPPGARLPAKRGRRKAGEAPVTAGDRSVARTGSEAEPEAVAAPAPTPAPRTEAPAPTKTVMMNDLLPFLGFVESQPVGTTIEAVVESYSSHGAYVSIGDVRAYVPLRLMADPPPRSAREVMKLGSTVALVVTAFHAPRRGIDLAVPAMAATPAPPDADAPARRRTRRVTPVDEGSAGEAPVATGRAAKKPTEKAAPKSAAKAAAKPATKPAGKAPRTRATKAADAPAADAVQPAADADAGTPETPPRTRRARAAAAPQPTPESDQPPAVASVLPEPPSPEPPSPEPAVVESALPAKRAKRAAPKAPAPAPAPKKAARTAPASTAGASPAEAPAPARRTRARSAAAAPVATAAEPLPPSGEAPAASPRPRTRTRAKG